MAETPEQKMWRKGRVPADPIMGRVDLWVVENESDHTALETEAGISSGYFGKARGYKTMEFRMADKILTAMGIPGDWWCDDLREHYLNVNLSVPVAKERKPGICRKAYCFNSRREGSLFCSEEHQNEHRARRAEYRRQQRQRRRVAEEAA